MKSILFTKIRFLAHKLVSSWQINEGAACMPIYIMNPHYCDNILPISLPPLLYLPLLPSTTCCPGKRFRCHWSSSWSSSSTLPSWPAYVTCATSPSPPSPWMLERSESTATEKFLEVCCMILCIDALDALSSSFLCALLTSQITGTARERLKVLANQVGAAVLGLEAGQL